LQKGRRDSGLPETNCADGLLEIYKSSMNQYVKTVTSIR
jgi:hypothetical protein